MNYKTQVSNTKINEQDHSRLKICTAKDATYEMGTHKMGKLMTNCISDKDLITKFINNPYAQKQENNVI